MVLQKILFSKSCSKKIFLLVKVPSVWSKSPFLTPFWGSEALDPRHFGPLKSGQKMILAQK